MTKKKSPARKGEEREAPLVDRRDDGDGGGSRRPSFPIVGIGASAGGLEALEALLGAMPPNPGMGFVVLTHQHPGRSSMLPELLGRKTAMPVVEASDGLVVMPDHVYVGAPGGDLAIRHGALHRIETGTANAPRLSIDFFLRSLAEDQGERAICIILSGSGTDGTIGMQIVKGRSGMAIVQEPASAAYASMPASAIATGLADYVAPPAEMPDRLVGYARGAFLTGAAVAAGAPEVPAEPMQAIFSLLQSHTGHDFSAYKSNTLRRRIDRRMNVHHLSRHEQYVRYLEDNPDEINLLFKELLISVTSFFRDADAWEVLKESLQQLVRSRPDDEALRAWVPGCATGEEAFGVGMVLFECAESAGRRCDVQVFGTDLDSDSITVARAARYPEGIAVDVPPARLDRFFVRDNTSYRVRKEIRDLTIFAPQNVLRDPPFTKLDLICCRNLLIYLDTPIQAKLLPIFHYALRPGGVLFLGPAETLGTASELFETVDRRWKIFRRREFASTNLALPSIPAQPMQRATGSTTTLAAPPDGRGSVASIVERLLLGRFVPASVLVNEQGDIFYVHGHTGAYLEPSPGQPRNNIHAMARGGLQLELSGAFRECLKTGAEVVRNDLRVETDGPPAYVDLTITPIGEPEPVRGLLLMTFRPTPRRPEVVDILMRDEDGGDDDRITQLRCELQRTVESHQSTLEELETSNEELKSTNEELQSANEELQSTNEEMETSKEEMQSLNEELTTVNAELQSKLELLSQANDDMQNLLNSTEIATVFLDNDLNIKRFTEQAKDLVMLRSSDVGRPISELASHLEYDGLADDCRAVLRTLIFREAEIETNQGGVYVMRIMPYRTADNLIDGLVLTFVNIGKLKQIEQALDEARTYFENIVDTVREPLIVLDHDMHVVSANLAFYRTFQTTEATTVGRVIYDIDEGQWNRPTLRHALHRLLSEDGSFEDLSIGIDDAEQGQRSFVLNARRLRQIPGLPGRILLAIGLDR